MGDMLPIDRGILILPDEVTHDTYRWLAEILLMKADQRIVLYCAGDGGSVRPGLAIVDLIYQHGHVVGMLPGWALSVHGWIWAACQERYVYPHGGIGVHKVGYSELNRGLDSKSAGQLVGELEQYERYISGIFAGASRASAAWWFEQIQKAGREEYDTYPAARLFGLDMARPAREFVMLGTQRVTQERGLFVENNGRVEKGDDELPHRIPWLSSVRIRRLLWSE